MTPGLHEVVDLVTKFRIDSRAEQTCTLPYDSLFNDLNRSVGRPESGRDVLRDLPWEPAGSCGACAQGLGPGLRRGLRPCGTGPRSNMAGQDGVQIPTADALWMCQEALLLCFDSETRGTWRLVCKRTCQAVEATTKCLTWDGDTNGNHDHPEMSNLHQYSALHRVRILRASRGLALPGLPYGLRALEVEFRPDQDVPEVEGLADVTLSDALSPCTALTQLKVAVLHCFPDTSLAALKFCTALRSLDLENWLGLTDISALSGCCNLHILNLTGCQLLQDIAALSSCGNLRSLDLYSCWDLQDITALSACCKLDSLNLAECVELQDITALSSCGNLRTLDMSGCMELRDITALSAMCNLHTLKLTTDLYKLMLSGSRQLQDITALAECSNLHTLDMQGSELLQDITPLSASVNLHSLELRGCAQLQHITALAACGNLYSLELRGCGELQHITALSACSDLHSLGLHGCGQLQDITALAGFTNLEYLDLSECKQLQDISVVAACCNLRTLRLCSLKQLLDITALSVCSNLLSLNLTGCAPQLQGITDLAAHCIVHMDDQFA
eukprot:gene23640-biopygen18171